jgi:hypothetical protein
VKKLAWALLLAAVAVSPAAGAGPQEAPSAQGPKAGKKPAAQKPPAPSKAPEPAPEPAPRKPFRWDVPGLIAWVDSPGMQISDGVPLSLQLARSKLSVETLIQHFADSFQKAGLFIPPAEAQVSAFREPQLTALDPEKLVAYTVIFQENPDGTVTLILGTSNLSQYNPGKAMSLLWAPLPPGAKQLMHTQLEGGQSAAFTVASSKEEVMAFYSEAMKKAGFEQEEAGVFRRGGEVITLYAQQQAGELAVALTRRLGPELGPPKP